MEKVLLAILDGVGIRNEIKDNAVKMADTPTLDYLMSGMDVLQVII